MMFRLSRRRRQVGETGNPRSHHPSGEQAYAALSEGRCLYALVSGCSGPPLAVDFGRDGGERRPRLQSARWPSAPARRSGRRRARELPQKRVRKAASRAGGRAARLEVAALRFAGHSIFAFGGNHRPDSLSVESRRPFRVRVVNASAQLCALKVRLSKIGVLEVRFTKIRVAQRRTAEVRLPRILLAYSGHLQATNL